VVSIPPLAAIVQDIGGDRVETTALVPPGTDPHHFELTPGDARALQAARVVFLIGGHFDRWALGSLSEEDLAAEIVEFRSIFTDSLLMVGDEFNPHFWLDPLFARKMGREVRDVLCRLDPGGCRLYHRRYDLPDSSAGPEGDFTSAIDSLDAEIRRRLEATDFRRYVGFHPAWTYFARRYGIEEAGILETAHGHEPSARHIAGIVAMIKAEGVDYVVAEEFSNPTLAEGVASETGARVLLLNPVGPVDLSLRHPYPGFLLHNVSVIEKHARRRE
jgi:ABC-type Zn uptake system ZnuABC Zn-binding protein ZnuA